MTGQLQSVKTRGSTQVETIRGDVQVKIAVIWVVGAVLVILAIGMVGAFIFKPVTEYSVFVASVGPIVSGVLFGLVGFVIGRNFPSQK